MAKGRPTNHDLEAKKVEMKSNQLAPPAATIAIAPAVSKPTVVAKKMRRKFRSHGKETVRVTEGALIS